MIDIQEKKEKIISFLKNNGPSLPVRIAHAIEMDPIIATAIASELIASEQIKTSNMKVGSSFLYLLQGQEEQLENFTENLKSIERNILERLREEKILVDENEEPATRIVLRSIKDFAKPFKFDGKIMWKYAFIEDSEIEEILDRQEEKTEEPTSEEEVKEAINEVVAQEEDSEFIETQQEESVPKAWEVKRQEIQEKNKKEIPAEQKAPEDIFSKNIDENEESEFLKEVKVFLKKKDIEFIEEIRTEKKEIMAKVKISSQLGDINMLLIAKDKKTTNRDEIRGSIQIATKTDMPCLLIIRKEPTKPIQKIIENNSLIKLEVME